jgi:hypothetical protein
VAPLLSAKAYHESWAPTAGYPAVEDEQRDRRSAATIVCVNRFAQPLDRKLDIVRLQMAPAFDFCQVPIFRVTLEVFRGELSSGRGTLVNFSRMKGSFGIPNFLISSPSTLARPASG